MSTTEEQARPVRTDGGRVVRVQVTPVAFRDPPLLNAVGVHEPFALRSVVELVTGSGAYGLGESYGDLPHLSRLRRAAEELVGLALSVGVGGQHRVDPVARPQQALQPVGVDRLAEVQEAPAAPGPDRRSARF